MELLWLLWGWTKHNVAGKKSPFLQHIVALGERIWTPQTHSAYPLCFMTQRHLGVQSERLIPSLAAIGWATLSPAAISSRCCSVSKPPRNWRRSPAACHAVYLRPAFAVTVIPGSNIGTGRLYQTNDSISHLFKLRTTCVYIFPSRNRANIDCQKGRSSAILARHHKSFSGEVSTSLLKQIAANLNTLNGGSVKNAAGVLIRSAFPSADLLH